MTDLVERVWADSSTAVSKHEDVVDAKVGQLTLVALSEAAISAAEARHAKVAASWAGDGPARVIGGSQANAVEAVAANGFLIHAGLADDSYRVAHHPGLTVIPAALAAAESYGVSGGDSLAYIVAVGYEFSCRLADLLLPAVSERGWRVTAVAAPIVSAAVMAHLRWGEQAAVAAARIGCSIVGGPLYAVNSGDDWQIQPALAAAAGFLAGMAATSHQPKPGGLESELGVLDQVGSGYQDHTEDSRLELKDVAFKRVGGPMYGQAIHDAVSRFESDRPVERIEVYVPPFAAGYANQSRQPAESSVASLKGVVLTALHGSAVDWVGTADQIEVSEDPELGALEARVILSVAGDASSSITGDGDTSAWTDDQVLAHVVVRVGAPVEDLAAQVLQFGAKDPEECLADFHRLADSIVAHRRGGE